MRFCFYYLLMTFGCFNVCGQEEKPSVGVDVLEKNLNEIVKKYNMDVSGKKSDEELKKQDKLIRQKQEELRKAVEEHNKKIKEDFENKKKESSQGVPENISNATDPVKDKNIPVPENEKHNKLKPDDSVKDNNAPVVDESKEKGITHSTGDFSKDIEGIHVKLNHLIERVNAIQRDVDCLKPEQVTGLKKQTESVSFSKRDGDKGTLEMKTEYENALKIFQDDPSKSIDSFESFARKNKDHPMAVDAHLKIAEAFMKVAKWDLANITLQNILLNDKISVHQNVEALLLLSDSQRSQNDRVNACKTLADLERSNLPMTAEQNIRYQDLIVSSDCASKLDKDVHDTEKE